MKTAQSSGLDFSVYWLSDLGDPTHSHLTLGFLFVKW